MKAPARLLMLLSFMASLSCTNAVPISSSSGFRYNAPTYSGGQSSKTYLILTYSDSITVSGACDPQTNNIKMSLDSGTSWQDPPFGDLICTGDGSFSFLISDSSNTGPLGPMGFSGSSPQGSKITIQLRSEAELGNSAASTFYIQYGNSISAKFANVMNGGGTVVGTQFIVKSARIGLPVESKTIGSASFRLHLKEGN